MNKFIALFSVGLVMCGKLFKIKSFQIYFMYTIFFSIQKAFLFGTIHSIKCYSCDSSLDISCADPYSKKSTHLVDCSAYPGLNTNCAVNILLVFLIYKVKILFYFLESGY